MISFISGKLDFIEKNSVFIDNNGIGYEIKVLDSDINKILDLSEREEKIKIYTFMAVKEDSICLYGFLSREELKMFCLLISVSGIGPKAATNILANINYDKLLEIISTEDTSSMSKVPGIGKKTAQRLIIELKDKILANKDFIANKNNEPKKNNNINDAIEALYSLGYQQSAINRIIFKLSQEISKKDLSTQDIIRQALKLLGK